MVDWNRVKRTDAPLSEEEREELLERLNHYVELFRSIDEKFYLVEQNWGGGEDQDQ
jgi:predicted HAD superfamily phosphohydrolase